MRMIRLSKPSLSLIAILLITSSISKAEYAVSTWESFEVPEGQLQLNPVFNYTYSDANFDESGQRLALPQLESLSRIQAELSIGYGITKRLSLFAKATWIRMQADFYNITPASQFGFGDQTLGANYRVWRSESEARFGEPEAALHIQLQTDFPAYNNQTALQKNVPFLGDGSVDVSGGLFLDLLVHAATEGRWRIKGGGGYTYRSDGFSSHVPFSAFITYDPWDEGAFFKLGGAGIFSLQTDTASGVLTGGYGSQFVNAINPNLVRLEAATGFQLNRKMKVIAGVKYAVFGSNTGTNITGWGGFQARWGDDSSTPKGKKQFKQYALSAKVTGASDQLNLIKIDKGEDDGLREGEVLDIYEVTKSGEQKGLIAKARVKSLRPTMAILKIVEFYKEIWIQPGFLAKRPID